MDGCIAKLIRFGVSAFSYACNAHDDRYELEIDYSGVRDHGLAGSSLGIDRLGKIVAARYG